MQRFCGCVYKKITILCIFVLTAMQLLFGFNPTLYTNPDKYKLIPLEHKKDNIKNIKGPSEEIDEQSLKTNPSQFTNRTHSIIQKIFLVSSNPRSGSSYAANILTAMPNSSYYYEPLRVTSHLTSQLQVF